MIQPTESGQSGQPVRGRASTTLLVAMAVALLLAIASTAAFGQGKMYWSDFGRGELYSADHDGGSADGTHVRVEYFVGGTPTGVGIDPAAGKIYWTNPESTHSINRTSLGLPPFSPNPDKHADSSNPESLALDLSVDGGKVYWSDKIDNRIQRANLDLSGVENVITTSIDEPRGIALDLRQRKIYWIDFQFDWIQRANLDGSGRETVISGLVANLLESVAVDTSPATTAEAPFGRIYWTEHTDAGDSGAVMRADLTATGVAAETIAPIAIVSGNPNGLVVDARNRKIYWAKRGGVGSGKITRADLDGQHAVDVVPEYSGQPFRLALDDFCGNDARDPGEECDDGNFADGDGCSSTCRDECGNGRLDGTEVCDDGDRDNRDGCSAECTVELGWSCPPGQPCVLLCGNGVVDAGETCDDGGRTGSDGCSATCTVEPGWTCATPGQACIQTCGNGVLDAGETCDDGARAGDDGCSPICLVEPGWYCTAPGVPCTTSCGDGLRAGTEQCDDHNLTSDDGCSASCGVEVGWSCPNQGQPCQPVCGDAIIIGGEECDDGIDNGAAGECTATCRIARCGDLALRTGVEQCEPPNTATCDAACLVRPRCDDGALQTGKCQYGNIRRSCASDAECDLPDQAGTGACGAVRSCATGRVGSACLVDADCATESGPGTCALQQVCLAGDTFRSCTGDRECDSSGGANDGVCYTEPCDDVAPGNTGACVDVNGQCRAARCGDGFIEAGVEKCEPPNSPTCDGGCQRRTSCRRRLSRLSFAAPSEATTRGERVQFCEPGQACDHGSECIFRLRLCLATPDRGPNVSCQPTEIVSVDFPDLDLDDAAVAAALTGALGTMGSVNTPRRCQSGERRKLCTADNDCDRYLGDPLGVCGPPLGVEFSPALAGADAPACVVAAVPLATGKRLTLRSRARGYLGHPGGGRPTLSSDREQVRLVCGLRSR